MSDDGSVVGIVAAACVVPFLETVEFCFSAGFWGAYVLCFPFASKGIRTISCLLYPMFTAGLEVASAATETPNWVLVPNTRRSVCLGVVQPVKPANAAVETRNADLLE